MKNKMRILYLVSTLRSCGPTNQLFYIIKYLDSQKFEPIILTLSPEAQDSAWLQFQKLGIPLHSLNLSRWQGIFLGGLKLKLFIGQYQPSVIHSQGVRPDGLSAKYLSNYKTVASIRNCPYHDYSMKYGKILGYYLAQQHINAFKKIKFAVSCSDSISKMVEQHGVKSQTISNGIDESLYKPVNTQERIELKQKLAITSECKIIISVGALIPRKQPDVIIKGFLASQIQKDSILLMLGDGILLDTCKAISGNASNIKFVGQVDNVVDYLKVADYFASASLSEGLPNSVIEALSCGVPVCLSDIEPHQEILALNPQAGVMFSTGNVEDLVKQLDKLINNRSESMSVAARSIVCEHLNARKMSENYQNIYLN